MLDCNKTITHVYRIYNDKTRQYDLLSETIDKCSWFETESDNMNGKGIYSSNHKIRVRIPLSSRSVIPQIKTKDILILGVINDEDLSSESELRQKYHQSLEVETVTYNQNSRPYSNHIKVVGS